MSRVNIAQSGRRSGRRRQLDKEEEEEERMFCLRKRGNAPQLINAADREGLLAENHITLLIGRSLGRVGGWLGAVAESLSRLSEKENKRALPLPSQCICRRNSGHLGRILNMQLISSNERAHEQEVPRVQQHLLLFIEIDISNCMIKWGTICGQNYFNYKILAPLKSNKIAFV